MKKTKFASALLSITLLTASSLASALVMGVTEGVTYRAADAEIEAKFAPIAKALATATKQNVKILVISSYSELREALKTGRLDVAFVHPAHVSLESIKSGTYKSAAWTMDYLDYKVTLLCTDGSAMNDWKKAAGKRLVTPGADSITAVMTQAMLREHKIAMATQVTNYQDAIPTFLDMHAAEYGATASNKVVQAWTSNGGKTCAQSAAVPIKHWLVASRLEAGIAATVKDAILNMSKSEAGLKTLAPTGYKGFVTTDLAREKNLTTWLGL